MNYGENKVVIKSFIQGQVFDIQKTKIFRIQ